MAPVLEKLPIPPALAIGEAPHWDIESQSLYLIHTAIAAVMRYDLATNKTYTGKLDLPAVNFIIPVAGSKGKFIIGSGRSLFLVDWDGLSDKFASLELLHVLTDEPDTHGINDGKCDPSGRLWFGTFNRVSVMKGIRESVPSGTIYSYSKKEGCRKQASGIYLSNGIAWDSEGKKMFIVDTYAYSIISFDCNSDGTIGNRKVVINLKDNNIKVPLPDGMTIDKDGKLWVALFGNFEVLKVDPEMGKILERISLPTAQVASVTWGGPNLDHLFVTTGNFHKKEKHPILEEDITNPDDGCTFRISGLSTSGLPSVAFKL